MRRILAYSQQVPSTSDILNTNRNVLMALGQLAQDVFGPTTCISGLVCSPSTPAALSVQIGLGRIYSPQVVDATAYSDLGTDTADTIVKQGALLAPVTLGTPAPVVAGQSIAYLIEAQYQDSDTANQVLPYYNSANALSPLSGQAGLGVPQPTVRDGIVSLQVKAGVSAPTGTQITPTADTGYTGLWVVTVAFGAASVVSGNIAQYPGAPFLSFSALTALTQANADGRYLQQYFRTTVEIAAGVVPTFINYAQGDIRRYGAALNGSTDDTAAVQRWLSVGGALTFPVAQTAMITSACTMSSNTTITAVKGATITSATGGISLFSATNKANISISGLKFVNTATTAGFPVIFAHCYFVGCARPTVQNCEFTGMNCGAITFDGCTDPIAENNNIYTGTYPATQQQTSDIALFGYTGATLRGIVTGNRCYGGGNFGIAVQDAYSGFNSANNLVSGNRIGGSQLYGVLVYMPSYAALNTFNQVVNNYIENIQGASAIISGQGGAGIYVVGAAAGGTLIEGNTIVNCCINTLTRGLAPAGIGIAGTNGAIAFTASVGGATSGTLGTGGSPAANGNWNGASGAYIVNFSNGDQRTVTLTNGATTATWSGAITAGTVTTATLAPYYNDPVTVANNKISGMTQYDGILVVGNFSGVALSNNTVNMPPGNTTGYALHISSSSNVTAVGGVLVNQGTGSTVFIENQAAAQNITLNGINISGGGNAASIGCVHIVGDGTHGIAGLTLSGLQVLPAPGGAGAAAIYITTAAAAGAQISNCYANVATMPALLIAACLGMRVSNNTLFTTGTNAIVLSGNCNGSFFDKTNSISGGLIANTSNGFHVDQFGPAVPTTGTWAKGDTVYNDSSVTTTNAMFMCTVAGTPGTWVGHG